MGQSGKGEGAKAQQENGQRAAGLEVTHGQRQRKPEQNAMAKCGCAIRANEITKAAIQWLCQSCALPAENRVAMMREPLLRYVQIIHHVYNLAF